MSRNTHGIHILLLGVLLLVGSFHRSEASDFDRNTLKGTAEDLWSSRIQLSDYAKGTTLIQPFSPSNCGFCLVDGIFVRQNYFEPNERLGGNNFLQCLFNPQLDIYAYLKHYREATKLVLTFPPALHGYHDDGFPFLAAFHDGKLVYSGPLFPYEETFRSLRSKLWPGRVVAPTPTSPLRMAATWTGDNSDNLGLEVYPDGDEAGLDQARKTLEAIEARVKEINLKTGWKWRLPYTAKNESQLSDADYRMNLRFRGITDQFSLKFLEGKAAPIQITSERVRIGGREFPKSEVGVAACVPNPLNKERYVVLNLRGSKLKSQLFENWVDYTIYKDGSDGKPEVLLHGFFAKDGANWRFSPALAFGTAMSKAVCEANFCPAPLGPSRTTHKIEARVSPWHRASYGRARALGVTDCRFPAIAVDENGTCWAAWEEKGDILLASVNGADPQKTLAIECDSSDNYNPVIAHDGSKLWVLYLNDQDGFYRLYGRSFDGDRLSDEVLASEIGPFDVVTPAVVSDGKGRLTIAWTEWLANCRYSKFRTVSGSSFGPVQTAATVESREVPGYVNAWYPSLTVDEKGVCWGAWNQHYPASLGVCSGNLVEPATSVTRITGGVEANECGGYPSIVVDRQGKRWVFWESFGWDVVRNKPQAILCSYWDEKGKQWVLPDTLSVEAQTTLNQTPRAAVDENGVIWVVWSGRKNDIDKPWGIYLSYYSEGKWSLPEIISEEGENARAPAICADKAGQLWISWHSGKGSKMQVKALEYLPKTVL